MAKAKKDGKEEYKQQIEKLEARRDLLAADLDKVEKQVADNWSGFKLTIQNRIKEMEEEVEEVFEDI